MAGGERRSTRSSRRAVELDPKEEKPAEAEAQKTANPEAGSAPEAESKTVKVEDRVVGEDAGAPKLTEAEKKTAAAPEIDAQEKPSEKEKPAMESEKPATVKPPLEAEKPSPEKQKPRLKSEAVVVKSKVEEPVKSPRHREEGRQREREGDRRDAKPKGGEERKDRGREGDRKDAPEKKELGRGDDRKREERDKSRAERPRESDRRKEDDRSKRPDDDRTKRPEDDRSKRPDDDRTKRPEDDRTKRPDRERDGKEADRRKEDEKKRHEDRKRESDRRGDRHRDEKPRDERSRKEDVRRDERREGDRGKRDESSRREREAERKPHHNDHHSEMKREPEKETADLPVALPPPPPLPPNAEIEKVNLDELKEGGDSAPAKDPPVEEKASKEERVDRRGEEKRDREDPRGRLDKDRPPRRERSRTPPRGKDPRESERHRERGGRPDPRERERERDRDRGRRPPSPPRRKHRSRSRSLSPRDTRRRSSPRRRSPPSSRPVNKRAGYYSSGLGGYSPRRRKNGDRDSPSLSPDRKRSKGMGGAWDQPPPGMDAAAVALWQQQMAVAQQVAAAAGANPFMQMGAASNLPNLNPLLAGMGAAQNPAATRSARRLYIGNLPPTVSDGEVLEFLNAAIISGGSQHVPGTRPVSAVQLTLDKGFGFADFTHPEDATRGTLLDGIVLHGNALKIRRPRDYVPPPTEILAASVGAVPPIPGTVPLPGQPVVVAAPGTVTTASSIPLAAIPQNIVPGFVSTDVPDGPNKIFLGNIHPSVTAEKLREILTAFGQLKHYVMKHNKNVKPFKVYAFLEYMDSAVTPQAMAGLSGLMLARKPLVTAYATPVYDLSSDKEPFYGVPDSAKPLLEEPSKVLELSNVLTREELLSLSEEEVEEIVEDATLECARFGTVKSHHLPRPAGTVKKEEESESKDGIVKTEDDTDSKQGLLQNGGAEKADGEAVTVKIEAMDEDEKKEDGKVEEMDDDDDKKQVVLLGGPAEVKKEEEEYISVEDPDGVGKLYVEFSREESAIKAAHALHNRMYNQRRVTVGYMPVKIYQKLYGKGFGLSHKSYDERQELSIKVQDFLYGPV